VVAVVLFFISSDSGTLLFPSPLPSSILPFRGTCMNYIRSREDPSKCIVQYFDTVFRTIFPRSIFAGFGPLFPHFSLFEWTFLIAKPSFSKYFHLK
jgi:hypothetical protein